MNKIEIWSREEWQDESNQTELEPDDIAKGMEDYGI